MTFEAWYLILAVSFANFVTPSAYGFPWQTSVVHSLLPTYTWCQFNAIVLLITAIYQVAVSQSNLWFSWNWK